SEAAPAVSAVRFGRRLAVPVEPNRYTYEKLGDLEAPTLQTDKYTVTCIAYRDAKRLFVETVIRNRADTAASLGQPFVFVQAGGRTLSMLDTARVAEEIHAGAVRDFVPTASGTDARTNQPLYDRRLVGEQAKRHIETQEREETFAALLLTFAYKESPTSIPAGEENTFIATFEPSEEKAGFEVCLRVGGEEFRFPFYS
ncbi:MAG: hypothetical protein KJZ78_16070, partial [Bryobacteraceae bacterium]|nr:hypothetical protein [Bryobacteraceae bacterium]